MREKLIELIWRKLNVKASQCYHYFGLNNIYFEKLTHTNVQNEQSGFGRKLQACKDHLPNIILCRDGDFALCTTRNIGQFSECSVFIIILSF